MLRREIAEGSENRCLSVIRSPATWMISAGRVNRSACNTRNTSLQQMFVVGVYCSLLLYRFFRAESVQHERVLSKIGSLHPICSI